MTLITTTFLSPKPKSYFHIHVESLACGNLLNHILKKFNIEAAKHKIWEAFYYYYFIFFGDIRPKKPMPNAKRTKEDEKHRPSTTRNQSLGPQPTTMGLYNVVVFISLFSIAAELSGLRNISWLFFHNSYGFSLLAIFNMKLVEWWTTIVQRKAKDKVRLVST